MELLVVDVGGTDIKWAVATDGEFGTVERTRTKLETPPALVEQLAGVYRDAAGTQPLRWAVCVAGLVDASRGRIVRAGNLGLENEPILERLAQAGVPPPLLVNDLAAAAAGEAAGGTLALLQIGSGVAGRLVDRGAVVEGVHGYGGEVGHLVFVPGGRVCRCGLEGCVEAYAGMASIRDRYAELGRAAPSPVQVLADAADDPCAAEILEDAFAALSFAAAVLVSVGDPGTVRLGGGLAAAWGERLRDAVARGIAARIPPELSGSTGVELSGLGDRAPLLGLLHLAGPPSSTSAECARREAASVAAPRRARGRRG